MATKTRPYHLTKLDAHGLTVERIVEATSRQQALYHAARTDWKVEPLSVNDAIRLGSIGCKREWAGGDEPVDAELTPGPCPAGEFLKAADLVD